METNTHPIPSTVLIVSLLCVLCKCIVSLVRERESNVVAKEAFHRKSKYRRLVKLRYMFKVSRHAS